MSGDHEPSADQLVALDGSTSVPRPAVTTEQSVPPETAFAPPVAPTPVLELAPLPPKPAGRIHAPPPPRTAGGTALFVALIAVVLAAAGVAIYWVRTHPAARGIAAGHGVAIKIVSPAKGTVAIDGHPAGTAPFTLSRAASTQPITISTMIDGSDVVVTVIPDHDQVVELRR